MGPIVGAIGDDDRRRRVLAEGPHSAQGTFVEVMARDGLVHEVKAEGAGNLRRPGRARPTHDVALGDRVSEREEVTALGRLLEAAVGGEVAHRDAHEAGQVNRD